MPRGIAHLGMGSVCGLFVGGYPRAVCGSALYPGLCALIENVSGSKSWFFGSLNQPFSS